jgi:hypothetical protein
MRHCPVLKKARRNCIKVQYIYIHTHQIDQSYHLNLFSIYIYIYTHTSTGLFFHGTLRVRLFFYNLKNNSKNIKK